MVRCVRVVVMFSLLITGWIAVPSTAKAVIRGSVSRYGPWAVRMLVDGKPHCTATAVSPEWIISASHCFYDKPDAPVKDKQITFRVGSLDERNGTPVHPVHGSRVENPDGADVVLIKVPKMHIPTAKLSKTAVKPGQRVRVFGWGATCTGDENNCQSNRLKQAVLRVKSAKNKQCARFGTVDGTDFCSMRVSGIPAGGDSGAPIMTSAPRGNEKLVGVFTSSDRTKMTGASAISHQHDWIQSVIKQ